MAKTLTIEIDGEDERKWNVLFKYLKVINPKIPEEEVIKTCFLMGIQKWESCVQNQLDALRLGYLTKYILTDEELKAAAEILKRKK